jgi:hypothetical protein
LEHDLDILRKRKDGEERNGTNAGSSKNYEVENGKTEIKYSDL